MIAIYLCVVLLIAAPLARGSGWSYDESASDGPEYWGHVNPNCDGTEQSPIDIQTSQVSKSSQYSSFRYINYNGKSATSGFTITDNGHTVQINTNTNSMLIENGGLSGEYVLEQFHFHWGSNDSTGSEHSVNGVHYPLEIHLVHRMQQYSSVNDALNDPNGVAVLGVFAKITDNAANVNPDLVKLIGDFSQVLYAGDTATIPPFPASSLLPQSSTFYRYHGSLTTPPCSQSVIWSVFSQPISITAALMEQFRLLHESDGEEILHNFRGPQPLDGRTVYQGGN